MTRLDLEIPRLIVGRCSDHNEADSMLVCVSAQSIQDGF